MSNSRVPCKELLLIVGWPQTVHVPPVLHAVASCAPAQLVLLYMKGAKSVYNRFLRLLGATICVW